MKRKSKVMTLLSVFLLTGYLSNALREEVLVQKYKNKITSKEDFIEFYLESLENSSFTKEEQDYLKEHFIPYLEEFSEFFSDQYRANILTSTENTRILRDQEIPSSNVLALYSPIIHYLPFGSFFYEGSIVLPKDASMEILFHEYCHSTQSFGIFLRNLYTETYASLVSKEGYQNEQVLFALLESLCSKEMLYQHLSNRTMKEFWDELKKMYPMDESRVENLKLEMETDFMETYQPSFLHSGDVRVHRENVIKDIQYLYNKYHEDSFEDHSNWLEYADLYQNFGFSSETKNSITAMKVKGLMRRERGALHE